MAKRSPWIHVADAALAGLTERGHYLDVCEVTCEYRTLGGLWFVQYTLHDSIEEDAVVARHGSEPSPRAAPDDVPLTSLLVCQSRAALCVEQGQACGRHLGPEGPAMALDVGHLHGLTTGLLAAAAIRVIDGHLLLTPIGGQLLVVAATQVFRERMVPALSHRRTARSSDDLGSGPGTHVRLRQHAFPAVDGREEVDQRLNGQNCRVIAVPINQLSGECFGCAGQLGNLLPTVGTGVAQTVNKWLKNRTHAAYSAHLWVIVNPYVG